MSRTKVKVKSRKVCIGDLNKKVTVHTRDIKSPGHGEVDYDETYTPLSTPWAGVETTAGSILFNGVNGDVAQTHKIFLRYDSRVSAQHWVELKNGDRLDILDVENLDEANEFLCLRCSKMGPKTKRANL